MGAIPAQLLRKAANSDGKINLATSTSFVLQPFYTVHSQAGTVFSVQLSQEYSAARPAESSKAVLFSPSHIAFSLRLFSSLAMELAMKLIYLIFLCLAHSSLLLS